MEPQRQSQATLADLLERVLDKGVLLKLDLVVGVAGIPLIGISVQGAIAAIETMLAYGMMESWDDRIRAHASSEAQGRQIELAQDEHIVLELYGSVHRARGILRAWRPGRLVLTSQRLLVIRRSPPETLFETRICDIAGIARRMTENAGAGLKEIIHIALGDGTLAALYTPQPDILQAGLRERCQDLGHAIAELPSANFDRLDPGAVAEGQLWHSPGGTQGPRRWRPGWAVLTPAHLTWWADPAGDDDHAGQSTVLRVPVTGIRGLTVHRHAGAHGGSDVLVVTYLPGPHPGRGRQAGEALFAGDGIAAWEAAIRRAAGAGDSEDSDG